MFTLHVKELIVPHADRPFASCHASHLAVLPDGDVLAVWFAGSKEGADDVAIWCARRHEGRWQQPYVLAEEEALPHWNPVLHRKDDGELQLYYKVGRLIKHWYTLIKTSKDQGLTWSDPVEIVAGDRGGRGPVRNKMVVLSDGAWLAPASTEDGIWQAFVDRSTDQGNSWIASPPIRIEGVTEAAITAVTDSNVPVSPQSFIGRGVIQPTLWESTPGQVHMLLRSSEGRIYRSDSTDGGRTWCAAYPTVLPNNNSGIDVVKLEDSTLVLVYNPVGINWGPRSPLVLSASRDNGHTWSDGFVLEEGEGEFSYPAIIAESGRLYVAYTCKRESIAYCELTLVT